MITPRSICLFSQKLLLVALKFGAPEFEDWGRGMFAELQSIEEPFAAFCWSAGCAWVVLQKGLPHKFARFSNAAAEYIKEVYFMRDAKLAAITAVMTILMLFAFTDFRQAMSVAGQSLINPEPSMKSEVSTAELDRLRRYAEQKGDGKLLAYVAVNDPRPAVAETVANQAVSLDPQWTWVYFALVHHADAAHRKIFLAKLEQWDPQNAANYLLEADQIRLDDNHFGHLSGNEAWLPAEARAVSFPKYDSYLQQHFNLERDIVMASGGGPMRIRREVGSHNSPNRMRLMEYAGFIQTSPDQASEATIRQARQLAALGEQMLANSEKMLGHLLAVSGYIKLQRIGGPDERTFATTRLEQLRTLAFSLAYDPSADQYASNAIAVQICLIVIVASSLAIAFAFLFHNGKGLRLLMWTSSALMILAAIVGYVSYLPFARLWAELGVSNPYMEPSVDMLLMFESFFSLRMHALSYGWGSQLVMDGGWDRLILALIVALLLGGLLFTARILGWTYRIVRAG